MKAPILFLDIDGVLVTSRYWNELRLAGRPARDESGDHVFDPACVEILRQIILRYNFDIVISSTWRMGGYDWMLELWARRNLPGKIVGCTPVMDMKKGSIYVPSRRGEEIFDYCQKNDVDRYIIIDDDCDMLEHQMPFFVETDFYDGLLGEGVMERVRNICEKWEQ